MKTNFGALPSKIGIIAGLAAVIVTMVVTSSMTTHGYSLDAPSDVVESGHGFSSGLTTLLIVGAILAALIGGLYVMMKNIKGAMTLIVGLLATVVIFGIGWGAASGATEAWGKVNGVESVIATATEVQFADAGIFLVVALVVLAAVAFLAGEVLSLLKSR